MALKFQISEGLLVCHNCGATYSQLLGKCPQCNESPIEVRTERVGIYLCKQADVCSEGGPDGICCISCPRFSFCDKPCYTAETMQDDEDYSCEFMEVAVK